MRERVIRVRCITAMLALLAVCNAGRSAQFPAGGLVVPPGGLQGSANGPTGTVTGRVMCGDTQRPARFAQVILQRVPTGGDSDGRNFNQGGGSAQTALDGTFVAVGIAPGDYYVTASAPGYIPVRQSVQAQINAGANPADVMARLPQVRVTADGVASVTVTMERGATVGGQVQWEDGSPATGVSVTAVSTVAPQQPSSAIQGLPFFGVPNGTTDDRGRFRLTGLPEGEYVLRAALRGPGPVGLGGFTDRRVQVASLITVWSPGVFRRGEAKPVTLRAGDERDDVRMVVNLGSLRTVAGRVSSSTGPAVAAGRVSLSDPNDRTIQLGGSIAPNGDFVIAYVPPGTYAMQVSASTQLPGRVVSQDGALQRRQGSSSGNASAGVTFQPTTQTVVVGSTDVTGVQVTLVPVQAGP